jgi:hypothetical protein
LRDFVFVEVARQIIPTMHHLRHLDAKMRFAGDGHFQEHDAAAFAGTNPLDKPLRFRATD